MYNLTLALRKEVFDIASIYIEETHCARHPFSVLANTRQP